MEAETERVEAETEREDKGGNQVGITAVEVEEVEEVKARAAVTTGPIRQSPIDGSRAFKS